MSALAAAPAIFPYDAPPASPRPAATAPAPAATTYRLEDPLPFDPAVRRGRLPNGMSYYIRRNARPEHRVALRLAVDAGSVLEQEDQRGLAHLLEHMAFNGSKHFAPGELVGFLESIGARFGADANAYTSFDETVYMLEVPTDRSGLVEKGLTVLADFAGGWTLSKDEIDKERGVVLEEWRLGQGANSRLQRLQFPILMHGSRYAERLPIGDPDVIKSSDPGRLRAFAREWYRPDRMAVAVVGDVDPVKAERWIQDKLGEVPAAAPGATRPVYDIPNHPETLVSVATDPEARVSGVSVIFKHPKLPEGRVGDYRRSLVETLFHSMVNSRLAEMARRGDAPFLGASSSGGTIGRNTDTEVLGAVVADGGIATGLRALLTEAERVRRHGFAPAELDRARRELLAQYERAWQERDKSESSSYAREYVSNFLTGEPSPGIDVELALVRQFLPTITLDEVRDVTLRNIHEDSRVVLAVAPQKEGVAVPTEAEVRGVLTSVTQVAVTPWEDRTAGRQLLEKPPLGGTVVSRRKIDPLGITVLTLSNGVEAWLKPTDFKNDQVVFGADAFGGASLAAPEHVVEALLSPVAVGEMGAGEFTPVEIEKLLAGKLVQVSPEVQHYTHGISGSSTPADLETALQLVYLELTAPNDRPEGFEVLRHRLETAIAHRASDPGSVYGDAIVEINTAGHYLYRPLLPRALCQRRRPHLRLRRQFRRGDHHAAPGPLSRRAALDGQSGLPLRRPRGEVPGDGQEDASAQGTRAAQHDHAHLLRRRREQRDGSAAGLDRGGRAAQPAARPAPGGDVRHLRRFRQLLGHPARARVRDDDDLVRLLPRERGEADLGRVRRDRPSAVGGLRTGGPQQGTGDRAARARGGGAPERLLAGRAAAHARPRPRPRPAAPAPPGDRRRHVRVAPGRLPPLLPGPPLHAGDADAGELTGHRQVGAG